MYNVALQMWETSFNGQPGVVMSDAEDIGSEVKRIISEQLGVEESKVQDASSLVDDLGADSLDTVELVMALEEKFEIEIPDEEAENVGTVSDIVKYIISNRQA